MPDGQLLRDRLLPRCDPLEGAERVLTMRFPVALALLIAACRFEPGVVTALEAGASEVEAGGNSEASVGCAQGVACDDMNACTDYDTCVAGQ